jgi:hypothetical protein
MLLARPEGARHPAVGDHLDLMVPVQPPAVARDQIGQEAFVAELDHSRPADAQNFRSTRSGHEVGAWSAVPAGPEVVDRVGLDVIAQ